MKIAVMGAGALGCYFGGRLAASGADVSFVARGAHLKALQTDGLRVKSPLGDLHIPEITATDDPAEIGPVDLILFLVKLYDTEAAAAQMRPMVGPETTVLSFQNGVNGPSRVNAVLGAAQALGGVAAIPAHIEAPGLVSHNASFASLTFGGGAGAHARRLAALKAALDKAGVDAVLVDDIEDRLWIKFIMLTTLSASTALTRLPIGAIRGDEEAAPLIPALLAEAEAAARAAFPALTPGALKSATDFTNGLPDHMRASMLDDLSRGKKLELMDLSGEVVRLGAAHGVPTPTHEFAIRALHPYAMGAPG